jgi:hypothetical protein
MRTFGCPRGGPQSSTADAQNSSAGKNCKTTQTIIPIFAVAVSTTAEMAIEWTGYIDFATGAFHDATLDRLAQHVWRGGDDDGQ